ncbi:hypothetical protein JAB8_44360 [Janthinobacterium sp. HH106]|nr:hypothetical protein JAB8_44360 [Janthinobacterium sp. HH106]
MPRAIGRLGAGACTMVSQHLQASFGRVWRITRKLPGIHSSCSATSSPNWHSAPSHVGQTSGCGLYTRSSRGRCSGSGLRAALVRGALSAGGRSRSASPSVACRSSSCNSSCSIWWSSFSDLRPNCMRRSLAIISFRCSISTSVVVSCARSPDTSSSCAAMATSRSRTICSAANSNAFRASMSLGRSAELSMGQVYARAPTFTRPIVVARCAPAGANRCLRAASTVGPASA